MSTAIDRSLLLLSLPDGLKDPLFESFNEIVRNFREHRWEPSELNGGKLCEVVYTILKGYINGTFPSSPSKPRNMVDACRALEQASSSINRSVRIQIPRILMALYEIRNNRGVGHIGGDVNPNHMDAIAVLYMSKWVLAEIIRIFHNIDTLTATSTVDVIVDRIIPIIWEVDGKLRVLKPGLSTRNKILVILYKLNGAIPDSKLISWIEYSNPTTFRNVILSKLHNDNLIEYNKQTHSVEISPLGNRYVEQSIDLDF